MEQGSNTKASPIEIRFNFEKALTREHISTLHQELTQIPGVACTWFANARDESDIAIDTYDAGAALLSADATPSQINDAHEKIARRQNFMDVLVSEAEPN